MKISINKLISKINNLQIDTVFDEFTSKVKKYFKESCKIIKKQELTEFLYSSLKVKKNLAFIAFALIVFLLPGSNYYLNLQLLPQPPYLRKPPMELDKPAKYPIKNPGASDPYISAKSAVVIDVKSAATLYEKNPDEKLSPASTTKIMTAMVVLDNFPLDKIVKVKQADESRGQTMNLYQGEEITVENLLYGLLMHSGNDAAYALAESYPGGYYAFVEEMNKLAQDYNLHETHYSNVSGIDQENHFTTVKNLARLAVLAMKDPIFAEIVSTKEKTVWDKNEKISHKLTNRNQLLGIVEGIRGIKTGWTENAKECLVTDTQRNGNNIITVVLSSDDRFGDSEKLIEWTFENFTWIDPSA